MVHQPAAPRAVTTIVFVLNGEDWAEKRGRKKESHARQGERGRHRISSNHLFAIFSNSSASRNPDRRRTPIDLTKEEHWKQRTEQNETDRGDQEKTRNRNKETQRTTQKKKGRLEKQTRQKQKSIGQPTHEHPFCFGLRRPLNRRTNQNRTEEDRGRQGSVFLALSSSQNASK